MGWGAAGNCVTEVGGVHCVADGKLDDVARADRGGVPGLPKRGPSGGWLGAVLGRNI